MGLNCLNFVEYTREAYRLMARKALGKSRNELALNPEDAVKPIETIEDLESNRKFDAKNPGDNDIYKSGRLDTFA